MESLLDLWNFLKARKKFWLLPIIIVLIIISALLIFGASSSLAPFIYTLF
jgi:competence protein ComGC